VPETLLSISTGTGPGASQGPALEGARAPDLYCSCRRLGPAQASLTLYIGLRTSTSRMYKMNR